ncbi:MAG: CotH kinase family protein [Ginsengibacter sp.]
MKILLQFIKQLLFFLLILIVSNAYSQQFSYNNVITIPDNGSVAVPINVSGLASIDTFNFGLESVTIDISHNDDQELEIQLQSPDGSKILLAKNLIGKGFQNTHFDGISHEYIDLAYEPFENSYRPVIDLAILNNSQNPNGQWNLIVSDNKTGNTGTVNKVTLTFGNQPAKPLLSSSNLPIVKINTNGNEIVDEPKIVADMVIIDNGVGKRNSVNDTNYTYNGKIGIEIRGSTSQYFPKKQYGFETRDAGGSESIDVSLLGLPKESDWILSANYPDKSLMRNVMAYQLAREMGNYAPRTIYCEVIINNEYRGVFVLEEKIKKGKDRVNIEKLSAGDTTYPKLTGGYMFSIDKPDPDSKLWDSRLNYEVTFEYLYPKGKNIVTQQAEYLANYVDSFERALNGPDFKDSVIGFRKYIDEKSFMDLFYLNEISNNIDGYRISSFFYKPRLGKIIAGPVWDYDIAWGNANYYNGEKTNSYVYLFDFPSFDFQVPFWWGKFMEDQLWKENLICRYNALRQSIFSKQHINNIIDSVANLIDESQKRNFIRWNILGQMIFANPEPIPQTYVDEVAYLKNWASARLDFLDKDLGLCPQFPTSLLDLQVLNSKGINKLTWKTGAEPDNNYFLIERSNDGHTFNELGKIVGKGPSKVSNDYEFNDEDIINGTMYYRIKQVDKDGNVSYSSVVSVNYQNSKWHLYPNQIRDQLSIYSPLNGNQKVAFVIYNMQGQRVKMMNLSNHSVIHQSVRELATGNYFLQITDALGNKTVLRFSKN